MADRGWRRRGRRAARSAAVALTLAALFAGGPAAARPLQLEDLLQREGFGAVTLAPGGRWLLVEQRGPLAAGSRFDFGDFDPLFRTRIMISDVNADAPLRPLFEQEAGVGYQAGPISPDGARAVVYRLTGETWELGVATLATGEVRWLGFTPEAPWVTRSLQWVSPTRLVVIALPPGTLPFILRAMRPQLATPQRWAASARGEASVTVVGSGRQIGARPKDPPNRLLQVSAVTGETETLATGHFVDLELSRSARHLALVEAAEDIPLIAGQEVQGAYGIALRRMRLRLLDLDTRALTSPLPEGDVLTSLLSWSPRTDDLLAYVRPDGAPWTDGRLVRVAAATGRVMTVGEAIRAAIGRRPERVSAGWWGAEPMLFGQPLAGGRNDWFRLAASGPVNLTHGLDHPPTETLVVSPGGLIVAADGAAWRIDRDGNAKRLSDRPFAALPTRIEGVPDRTSYALHEGSGLSGVLGVGGDARAVAFGAGGLQGDGVAAPASGPVVALGAGGAAVDEVVGGGRETLVWRRAGSRDTVLARINARLEAVHHPQALAIAHAGPNGEPLKSWLFLPDRPADAGPPPLVVVPYPGARHAQAPDIWNAGLMDPTAVLLGHGYAVLVPSLPSWRAGGGPADRLAERILAIVDAAARQPDLAGGFDPGRLALWGHSFGGYAVAVTIGQTDRFRAAVAAAPATDLISRHGQFELTQRVYPEEGLSVPWSAGWVESLQGDMRRPPWEDPDRYLRNSPLLQAGRIHTPLLLAYGELDGSHPGQAEELFSALYRQDKDALLLTYWGESHLFESPGNLRDVYGRGLDFLDRHLTASAPRPGSAPPPEHRESATASVAPTTPPPPPATGPIHPPA